MGIEYVERNKQIIKLTRKGMTASQVGRELNCSRNAVIGVLDRAGVRRPPPKRIGWPSERPDEQTPYGCRWIEGDPKKPGWAYCHGKLEPGFDYCPDHRVRIFRPREEVPAIADAAD